MYLILQRFKKAEQPMSGEEIITITQLPIKIVNEILGDLTEVNILVEGGGALKTYTPALDIRKLTIPFVQERMRSLGINEVQVEDNLDENKVEKILKKMDFVVQARFGKVRIADL